MREFVLPGTKIRLQISQQQLHDRQALVANANGGVQPGTSSRRRAYLQRSFGESHRKLRWNSETWLRLACVARVFSLGWVMPTSTFQTPSLTSAGMRRCCGESCTIRTLPRGSPDYRRAGPTWGTPPTSTPSSAPSLAPTTTNPPRPTLCSAATACTSPPNDLLAATIVRLGAERTLISWQPRGKDEESDLQKMRDLDFAFDTAAPLAKEHKEVQIAILTKPGHCRRAKSCRRAHQRRNRCRCRPPRSRKPRCRRIRRRRRVRLVGGSTSSRRAGNGQCSSSRGGGSYSTATTDGGTGGSSSFFGCHRRRRDRSSSRQSRRGGGGDSNGPWVVVASAQMGKITKGTSNLAAG